MTREKRIVHLREPQKKQLAKLLPTLKQLGCKIPKELQCQLNGHLTSKLSREQVKSIERGLNKYGRVVVNIMGRNRDFYVTSLHNFAAKQQQAKYFYAERSKATTSAS